MNLVKGGIAAALLLSSACSNSMSSDDLRRRGGDTLLRSEMWKLENTQCAVKGNAANWQAAYCLWMNKTNDFEKEGVQECFDTLTEREGIPTKLCDRNEFFKREICRSLMMEKLFIGTFTECLASDGSVPRVVREGL